MVAPIHISHSSVPQFYSSLPIFILFVFIYFVFSIATILTGMQQYLTVIKNCISLLMLTAPFHIPVVHVSVFRGSSIQVFFWLFFKTVNILILYFWKIYICIQSNRIISTPPLLSYNFLHILPTYNMPLPNFTCFAVAVYNPLSPISATHLCNGVGPVTGAWGIYQQGHLHKRSDFASSRSYLLRRLSAHPWMWHLYHHLSTLLPNLKGYTGIGGGKTVRAKESGVQWNTVVWTWHG